MCVDCGSSAQHPLSVRELTKTGTYRVWKLQVFDRELGKVQWNWKVVTEHSPVKITTKWMLIAGMNVHYLFVKCYCFTVAWMLWGKWLVGRSLSGAGKPSAGLVPQQRRKQKHMHSLLGKLLANFDSLSLGREPVHKCSFRLVHAYVYNTYMYTHTLGEES